MNDASLKLSLIEEIIEFVESNDPLEFFDIIGWSHLAHLNHREQQNHGSMPTIDLTVPQFDEIILVLSRRSASFRNLLYVLACDVEHTPLDAFSRLSHSYELWKTKNSSKGRSVISKASITIASARIWEALIKVDPFVADQCQEYYHASDSVTPFEGDPFLHRSYRVMDMKGKDGVSVLVKL